MIHSPGAARAKVRSIIILLLRNKIMYGYELSQSVKSVLAGSLHMTEGGIYPTLHVLEKEGVLVAERTHIGKRVRKYYTLSKKSKRNFLVKNQQAL